MTREQYFEMCNMLGSEPVESEIPIEFSDLMPEVQEAFQIYILLNDMWDGMSGAYMGKNMSGISDILDLYKIEDKCTCVTIIKILDKYRSNSIELKRKSKTPSTPQ